MEYECIYYETVCTHKASAPSPNKITPTYRTLLYDSNWNCPSLYDSGDYLKLSAMNCELLIAVLINRIFSSNNQQLEEGAQLANI